MKEKKKTPKLLKLGEIDYGEKDGKNIKPSMNGKSGLDALDDPKYEKKNNEYKSKKERTPEERIFASAESAFRQRAR